MRGITRNIMLLFQMKNETKKKGRGHGGVLRSLRTWLRFHNRPGTARACGVPGSFFPVICCLLSLCFGGLISVSGAAQEPKLDLAGKKVVWIPVYQGVDLAVDAVSSPRLQQVRAARIDTKAKGLRFCSTPRKTDDYQEGSLETVRRQTGTYLSESGIQLAVNANFFGVPKGEVYDKPGSSDLLGAAVNEGIVVSLPAEGFPAIYQDKNGKSKIVDGQKPDADLAGIETAVAGNVIILRGGEILPQGNKAVHPRTAVGISQDERYVYLLVIDGRRRGYSEGANYEEVAAWLKYFGSWDGLNLDGGGSTAMVIQGNDQKAIYVNRPSGAIPRFNGNNYGVHAQRLPKSLEKRGMNKLQKSLQSIQASFDQSP